MAHPEWIFFNLPRHSSQLDTESREIEKSMYLNKIKNKFLLISSTQTLKYSIFPLHNSIEEKKCKVLIDILVINIKALCSPD